MGGENRKNVRTLGGEEGTEEEGRGKEKRKRVKGGAIVSDQDLPTTNRGSLAPQLNSFSTHYTR